MNYKNKEKLEELYLEEELTTRQIAQICDCGKTTVRRWLKKHEIPRRPEGFQKGDGRVERAHYCTNRSGYERWTAQGEKGTTKTVGISQLTAIAHGADPHKVFDSDNYETHHRNKIPWDNRPANLEVVSKDEHREIHQDDNYVYDARLGCDVLDSPKRYGRVRRSKVRSQYANADWYNQELNV